MTDRFNILIFFMLTVLGLSMFVNNKALAQDPQFSQYYAAPLYMNPALAGINQQGRAGVNYRQQWPSIPASFETFSAYIDYNFEDYNSSGGLIVTNDREGLAGLNSTTIGLQYAY
ncbi:MAG: PorP/SprF family type IX secretion system membrane protein, partial [Bacteroidota bacterium]